MNISKQHPYFSKYHKLVTQHLLLWVKWKPLNWRTPASRKDRHRKKTFTVLDFPCGAFALWVCVCVFGSSWMKGCEGIPFNSTGRNFSESYFPQLSALNYNIKARSKLPPEWQSLKHICGDNFTSYDTETSTFHRFLTRGYRPKRVRTAELKIVKASWIREWRLSFCCWCCVAMDQRVWIYRGNVRGVYKTCF